MNPGDNMAWTWPLRTSDYQRQLREDRTRASMSLRRMTMFGHLLGSMWRTAEGLRI